jgi:hypothetical protein
MTLQQQLESYLAGETLTLPAGALATAGIQTVIEEFYAGGQLVINQAVLTANATGTTVTIAGASSLIAVTAMPVTAVFETTGTGLILTLTAVPPADWKFSRSFTSLAGSFYDQLTLSGSSLVLSSADQSSPLPLAAGLNYAGNIGAGLPVPLSLLLTGPVALAGAIQIDHGVPAMTLAITPAIMLGMGSLTLPAVDCALTSAATQIANDNGSTWISSNSLTFQSTLSIGAKTVSVAGAYAITTESLDIEVVNQSISLADGLQDVFALVNYTPAIAWPAAFNLNNIYLSNIGLSISFEPSVTLDNFSFGVAWNTAWDVIPGVVTLNKIDVNIWISSPFASATRQYGGQIYGQFLLGAKSNTIFDIYATIPTSRTKQGWTFAGYTQPGAVLAIGSVAADFCARFGIALPDVLQKFTLKNLYLGLNPADSSVNGYFTLDFAIGATPIEITINAALSKSGTQYGVVVSGQLTIGGSVFSVALNASAGATTFSASWRDPANPLGFGDIARAFGWDDMPALPEDLDLGLTDAEFYYDFSAATVVLSAHSVQYGQVLFASLVTPTSQARVYVFALDIPLNLQLSDLPLIGAKLPANAQLGVQDLQVIVASGALAAADVSALNTLLTGTLQDQALIACALGTGLTFATRLQMGSTSEAIVIPLTSSGTVGDAPRAALPAPSAAPPAALPLAAAPTYQAGATWFNIEKKFGPVQIQRIGVQYQDGTLSFLLDATLSLATLSLSCDGLGVGSPLAAFAPTFHLDGIAIAFSSGPVTIDGGLLVLPTALLPPGVEFEYTGDVVIKVAPWVIAGVASYAKIDHAASFFLFAQVSGEFGGSPAFFITGFMGGFGYNSQLALPAVDQVATFPFVAGLDNPAIFGVSPTPMSVLNVLSGGAGAPPIVTPTVGESWLAAGVTFSSFELVFGRVLAVVEFGGEFEIALLGLASTSLPQGATDNAYAYIELQLEVIIKPDDGLFSASGSLTSSSFVITKDCHLTGGFAFCNWFGSNPHAGDFVVVIGGYHPAFVPPPWYPRVAAVGFNWQVDSDVTIKGGAYFALTPSAIMAGGSLEVLYQSGAVRAWFIAYANLLITWKPFHFSASIGISLGAAVRVDLLFTTVTISVELGATLDLWGPPTGGVVHIHLYIISFSVAFGADQDGAAPPALDWSGFQALLPQSAAGTALVLGAQVNRGLARQGADGTWYVRADELIFTTQTAVPATSLSFGAPGAPALAPGAAAAPALAGIAIRPMAVASATSAHTVTLTFLDDPTSDAGWSAWTQVPQVNNLPEALWGAPLGAGAPPAPSSAPLPGLLTGVQLIAPAASVGASPGPMNIAALVDPLGGGYAPLTPATQVGPYPAPGIAAGIIGTIASTLASDATRDAQQSLVAALTALQAAPPTSALLVKLAATAGSAFAQLPLLAA